MWVKSPDIGDQGSVLVRRLSAVGLNMDLGSVYNWF